MAHLLTARRLVAAVAALAAAGAIRNTVARSLVYMHNAGRTTGP